MVAREVSYYSREATTGFMRMFSRRWMTCETPCISRWGEMTSGILSLGPKNVSLSAGLFAQPPLSLKTKAAFPTVQ